MPTRSRTLDKRIVVGGSLTYHGTPPVYVNKTVLHGEYLDCTDVTGNREGVNPLTISIRKYDRPTLSGSRYHPVTGVKTVTFDGYPTGYQPNPVDPFTIIPAPTLSELMSAYWEITALTNPNTPEVNVPQMLGELKDLPGLVQGWGKDVLKNVARGHLSWRWAIKPMLSDLRKLCNFAKAVDERLRWLKKLKEGKPLRRKCFLKGDHKGVDHGVVIYHSESANISCRRVSHCLMKRWGSCEWILVGLGDIPPTGIEQLELARKLASGRHSYALLQTAWELTPWSWLSDWFTNIGNFIASNGNAVSVRPRNVCVMQETRNITSFPLTQEPQADVRLSHMSRCVWHRKNRYLVAEPLSPFLPTKFPFLDERKWSILVSLAALGSLKKWTGIPGL